MRTSDIWNQFDLHGRKALVMVLLAWLGFSTQLYAQKGYNLPRYDYRKMHYGFQLGLQFGTMNIVHSKEFVKNNMDKNLIAILSKPSTTFSVGLITDFSLDGEYWHLRLNPNVTFYEHGIIFRYGNADSTSYNAYYQYNDVEEKIEAAFFEFPILLKFKSERRTNTRFYLIGGIIPSLKVGGTKRKLDKKNLATDDYNLEITYGIGLDQYLNFFKFAPELRISHGVGNMLLQNGNPLAKQMTKLYTHRISLYLNFE